MYAILTCHVAILACQVWDALDAASTKTSDGKGKIVLSALTQALPTIADVLGKFVSRGGTRSTAGRGGRAASSSAQLRKQQQQQRAAVARPTAGGSAEKAAAAVAYARSVDPAAPNISVAEYYGNYERRAELHRRQQRAAQLAIIAAAEAEEASEPEQGDDMTAMAAAVDNDDDFYAEGGDAGAGVYGPQQQRALLSVSSIGGLRRTRRSLRARATNYKPTSVTPSTMTFNPGSLASTVSSLTGTPRIRAYGKACVPARAVCA